jgi:hypothetical protein
LSPLALPDPVSFVSSDGKTEYVVEIIKQKAILQDSIVKRTIKVTRRQNAVSSNKSDLNGPDYSQKYLTKSKSQMEEVRIIKHVQDVAWVDNAAPDLKGSEKLNYLRMKYLVTKMIKMRDRQICQYNQ